MRETSLATEQKCERSNISMCWSKLRAFS